MITKFKIFENSMEYVKPGDVIVCISKGLSSGIKYGRRYKINEINKENSYLISIRTYSKNIIKKDPDTNNIRWFFTKHFVSEAEWNAQKYNI